MKIADKVNVVNFVTNACDALVKAIEFDSLYDHGEAMKLYLHALDQFRKGLKYEQRILEQNQIKAKVLQVMARAELVKDYLENPKNADALNQKQVDQRATLYAGIAPIPVPASVEARPDSHAADDRASGSDDLARIISQLPVASGEAGARRRGSSAEDIKPPAAKQAASSSGGQSEADEQRAAALTKLNAAAEADQAEQYVQALPLYQDGLTLLFKVVQAESNPARKAKLKVRLKEYMDRAEAIKAHLDKKKDMQ